MCRWRPGASEGLLKERYVPAFSIQLYSRAHSGVAVAGASTYSDRMLCTVSMFNVSLEAGKVGTST